MATEEHTRLDELTLGAADAIDQGADPFSTAWLSEHKVTLDECWQLSHNIAGCIRAFYAVSDAAHRLARPIR